MGYGNIIYKSVSFGALVEIGNFNTIFHGSVIGHQSQIGNNCLVAASCTIGARTIIRDRVYLSKGVLINLGIEIVSDVFVGLGSVVLRSIKKKKVFGYPAKELKY